jgi:hypothetical protein
MVTVMSIRNVARLWSQEATQRNNTEDEYLYTQHREKLKFYK